MSTILPTQTIRAIEQALGVVGVNVTKADEGVSGRAYVLRHGARRWALRVEDGEALQLKRGCAAQRMAREADVVTPEIIADNFVETGDGGLKWVVEEWIDGAPFERPDNATSVHLGEQLRRLHTVRVDSFGLIPPNPYSSFPSCRAWLDHEAMAIDEALSLCDGDLAWEAPIRDAYETLANTGPDAPRLCHGDCAGANILTRDQGVVALIDWEWARGGDPAANIAYWAFWLEDDAPLDALLDGYAPDDPALFRRRVEAYRIPTAISLIHVYREFGDAESVRYCGERLESFLQ